MKILFVHQNFPGQYKHLAAELARNRNNKVYSISEEKPERKLWLKHHNINYCFYKKPEGAGKNTHRYLEAFEEQVRRGQAVARICIQLRKIGFIPDIICAHPGWGEALFLKDVFPEAKLLSFCEFYYGGKSTLNFDPEFSNNEIDSSAKLRIMNSHLLLSLDACERGISPTRWQHENHPEAYKDKISVIFDGIDTDVAKPEPSASFKLPDGQILTVKDEVISFVNRNLEPYRGWHIFCRALPDILKRRPKARIIIVGGDEVSYGTKLPPGKTYKQKYLDEVKPDLSRVHFTGKIPYSNLISLFQIAKAHIYLTYPFVLSWSMLEAMSCGCPVIGSRTKPVEEMITDGETGFLSDFFDSAALAEKVDNVISDRENSVRIGKNAREFILRNYDLKKVCLPAQMRLISDILK
ncbi:MAG: glycosyl transferase family 1 [Lentisphaerae bacterium GWF2_44_16]|nr:MAG: glycosyl transferase family 1 [Lentisphaerae bacterium GWF2_44_16]